jgi:hypothetical protein
LNHGCIADEIEDRSHRREERTRQSGGILTTKNGGCVARRSYQCLRFS